MIGNTENDGSLFALNQNNLATYLASTFGTLVSANQVRALYASGLSDNAVISEVVKDFLFLWSVVHFLHIIPPNALTARRSYGAPPPWVRESRMCIGMRTVRPRRPLRSAVQLTVLTGAVFADLQLFANAGAWHSSERPSSFLIRIRPFP
jgi:hypothetical protein